MRFLLIALSFVALASARHRFEVSHLNDYSYRDLTLPANLPQPLPPDGVLFSTAPEFAPGSLAIVSVEANWNPPEFDEYFRVVPIILFKQGSNLRPLTIVKQKHGAFSSGYAVQIPSAAGIGEATILVEYPGEQNSLGLEIVRTRFELIRDPRVAWQASVIKDGMAVGLAHPLQTGKPATLVGTGLGQSLADRFVSIRIGNPPIDVGYVNPRKGEAGLDLLDFQVPPTVSANCYAAVRVLVDGVAVDSLFVPVSKNEGPCAHPRDLTKGELQALDSGKCLPFGTIGFNGSSGFTSPIPGIGSVFSSSEQLVAQFTTYSAEELLAPELIRQVPKVCSVVTPTIGAVGGGGPRTAFVDPYRLPISCGDARARNFFEGSKLTAISPTGRVSLFTLDPVTGFYFAPLSNQGRLFNSSEFTVSEIEQGVWEITGTESAGINFFSWHVPVNPLRGLNVEQGAIVLKDTNWTVSWDSTGYKQGDTTQLMLFVNNQSGQSIFCQTDASEGRVRISPENLAAVSVGGVGNLPAFLTLDVTTKPEIKIGETKGGDLFRTAIGGYFRDQRGVTLR